MCYSQPHRGCGCQKQCGCIAVDVADIRSIITMHNHWGWTRIINVNNYYLMNNANYIDWWFWYWYDWWNYHIDMMVESERSSSDLSEWSLFQIQKYSFRWKIIGFFFNFFYITSKAYRFYNFWWLYWKKSHQNLSDYV